MKWFSQFTLGLLIGAAVFMPVYAQDDDKNDTKDAPAEKAKPAKKVFSQAQQKILDQIKTEVIDFFPIETRKDYERVLKGTKGNLSFEQWPKLVRSAENKGKTYTCQVSTMRAPAGKSPKKEGNGLFRIGFKLLEKTKESKNPTLIMDKKVNFFLIGKDGVVTGKGNSGLLDACPS